MLQDNATALSLCSAIRLHRDQQSGHRFIQCNHRPFIRLSHNALKQHTHCRSHRSGLELNNLPGLRLSSMYLRENHLREPYVQVLQNFSPVHPHLTLVMTSQTRGTMEILGSGLEVRHGTSIGGHSTTIAVIKQ